MTVTLRWQNHRNKLALDQKKEFWKLIALWLIKMKEMNWFELLVLVRPSLLGVITNSMFDCTLFFKDNK